MKTLEYNPPIKDDLSAIEKFFGGQNEVARILGVDKSQISRWHREGRPDRGNIAKIYAINFIVAKLMALFRYGESARKWLQGMNAILNNRCPLDLLKEGRFSEIADAIDQYTAGSYA